MTNSDNTFTILLDSSFIEERDELMGTQKLTVKSRHYTYWWNRLKNWVNTKFGTDFEVCWKYNVSFKQE